MQKLALVGEDEVCTSVIVAAELRYGALRKGSERLTARLDALLERLPVMAFEPPADAAYGRLRSVLEKSGVLIGGNDMLIAAHALSLDCVVVTDNEREFRRVDGLRVENWLRDG